MKRLVPVCFGFRETMEGANRYQTNRESTSEQRREQSFDVKRRRSCTVMKHRVD